MLDTEWVATAAVSDGEFRSGQPYLRERLSLKVALCRAKPCSSMGSVVSQVEATLVLLSEFHGALERGWLVGLEIFGIFLLHCAFGTLNYPLDRLLNRVATIQLVVLVDDSVH